MQKTFAQYGIDEKMWDLIRKHPIKNRSGKNYITVDSTFDYTKEAIAEYLKKPVTQLTEAEIEAVRDEARHKLLMFNRDLVDYVRIVPDAVENAKYIKGSFLGQGFFGRTFMQFKGYPIAMARRILSLVIENSVEGFKNDGFTGMARGIPKDSPAALTFAANLIILSYLSDSAKRLVRGQTPRDPEDPETWATVIASSGIAGIYSDMINTAVSSGKSNYNVDVMASLAGPAWSDIKKAGNVALKGIVQNKLPENDFFNLIKGNIPFINLPYTHLAVDYLLMWNLQEQFAPKSYYKMKLANDYYVD
jgi:hypothetical protein